MKNGPNIAVVSALIGDPARANILTALLAGKALTANELARESGVTPQTASGHLAQLLTGGLVSVERQGRHRYYRLADSDVAGAIEALMALANRPPHGSPRVGPKDPALRRARICYDHLAGELGVRLFALLCDNGIVVLSGGSLDVTGSGENHLANFGIPIGPLRLAKRPICRSCLDWSERQPHLAGGLGAALLERILDLGWARRVSGERIIHFSPSGEQALHDAFGSRWQASAVAGSARLEAEAGSISTL